MQRKHERVIQYLENYFIARFARLEQIVVVFTCQRKTYTLLLLFVVELCVCYWPGLEEECSSIPGIFVSRSLSRGGFGCVSLLSFEHG